jgi:hypothetical protein
VHCGEFEDLLPDSLRMIEQGRFHNVIFNLDQCGHSKINRSTISRLMSVERSVEVFLTYAIEAFVSFLTRSNPEIVRERFAHLAVEPEALSFSEDLLSKNEWLGAAERVVFDYFGRTAPFVTPFSIHNPTGWRYWFMHFANSYRARQVYNDVLHENSSQQAHFGRSGLRMLAYDPSQEKGELYLFDTDARAAAKGALLEDIPRLVSGGGDTMLISDFFRGIYNDTPAHSDDINDAIIENPDLEVLTELGNERRFARTISVGDTLRLKKQLSFYLPPINIKK